MDFWWNKDTYGYYIVGKYSGKFYEMWMCDLSVLLKIDRNFLCRTLIDDFNGFMREMTSGRIYFNNQNDVNKAIQWLETVKISLKMI